MTSKPALAAEADRATDRFMVYSGITGESIEVATRAEAVRLAAETNGNWTRL